jgi:hypothetical protein
MTDGDISNSYVIDVIQLLDRMRKQIFGAQNTLEVCPVPYHYAYLPTRRPVPPSKPIVIQKAIELEDKGIERWVILKNLDLTAK